VESQLKWPNDLLVRDRKLGGILCEGRWRGSDVSWVAIGVGINVHGPLPVALAGRAIPLDEVLPDVSRMDLLVQFVPRLHTLPDESALTDAEQAAFQRYDWLRGRAVRH
ncbi:MAG: hypothetical protein GTO31_10350, partial [Xanthomonadales bacterium]|nr:hypothetical protein [Xanthomonadales bacterium]